MADEDESQAEVAEAEEAAAGPHEHVNLGEASRILRVSTATLRQWAEFEPDFPAPDKHSRGRNGVAYRFHLPSLRQWYLDRQEREQRRREERAAFLRQAGFDFGRELGEEEESSAAALTPAEQKALLEARILQNKLARENRELVEANAVRLAVSSAFAQLRQDVEGLADWAAYRFSLDRSQAQDLRDRVDSLLTECSRRLAEPMEDRR